MCSRSRMNLDRWGAWSSGWESFASHCRSPHLAWIGIGPHLARRCGRAEPQPEDGPMQNAQEKPMPQTSVVGACTVTDCKFNENHECHAGSHRGPRERQRRRVRHLHPRGEHPPAPVAAYAVLFERERASPVRGRPLALCLPSRDDQAADLPFFFGGGALINRSAYCFCCSPCNAPPASPDRDRTGQRSSGRISRTSSTASSAAVHSSVIRFSPKLDCSGSGLPFFFGGRALII